MDNSKSINKCRCCDDWYCINCSDANAYWIYCSINCEKEDSIPDEEL